MLTKTSRESEFMSYQIMIHTNFWNDLLQIVLGMYRDLLSLERLQRLTLRYSLGHSWLLSLKYFFSCCLLQLHPDVCLKVLLVLVSL